MNRSVQAVLMVLFGGVVIRVVVDGAHLNYVKPAMGPWLLLAGAVLLVLGALAVVEVFREGDGADHEGDSADADGGAGADARDGAGGAPGAHGHGHDHAQMGPRAAWGLL
ncbi:MAG: DUF1980 domain-containing protein, partial [Candidatus Nanopelagicales bacterium]|nr:DUF1980 domain-containing protein [Candidatus Nanopelagicales bacterium]